MKKARKDRIDEITKTAENYPLRYIGNKGKILPRILHLIPETATSFVDLFAGTSIVGWGAKQLGLQVTGNDILSLANLRHTVFVSNNTETLTAEDLSLLLRNNGKRAKHIETMYGNIFGLNNSEFMDNWASNIPELSNQMKKDLAAVIPVICCSSAAKYDRFHFSPYGGLSCQDFWKRDLKKLVIDFVQQKLPNLIIDNNKQNQCYQEDAITLLPKISADVLYVDPPYCGTSGSDYQADYAFLDDLLKVMLGRADEIDSRYDGKCELPDYTRFGRKGSALDGFDAIFANSKHIPQIIISYNSTSRLDPNELATLAEVHGRTVEMEVFDHPREKTKKETPNLLKEVLINCK